MPTSLEYLHDLAEECVEFGQGTTTSPGTANTLIFSTFVNTTLDATELAGMFVLIESGACIGQVGSIKSGGLTRSTGTITVGDDFSAVIASGVSFSLYRLFPPKREGVIPGFLEALNQGLRRVSFPDRISFTGVTAQQHYSIDTATYPWWTDEKRIMWVEWPVTASDDVPRRMADAQWDWLADAETRKLYFPAAPFKTGESFTVRVMRPGNSRLKINGTWTDQTSQTAGLALFTSGVADEAIPDAPDLVTVAKARLYELLSNMQAPRAEVAAWLEKAGPSIRAARDLIHRATNEDRTAGVAALRPTLVTRAGDRRFDGRNLY